MSKKASSEDHTRFASDRKQPRRPCTGLSRGAIKRKEEDADKGPSTSTLKQREKKAKAKTKAAARKESEGFQERKAMWEGAKSGTVSRPATKIGQSNKSNQRKDKKFKKALKLSSSY